MDKAKAAVELAHLLQGVEAKALQAALSECPSGIVLLQHDGFVASYRLNVPVIEARVVEATGYHLMLEESKVWIDFSSQFMKNSFQHENDDFPFSDKDLAE